MVARRKKPKPTATKEMDFRDGKRVLPSSGTLLEFIDAAEEWNTVLMLLFGAPGIGKTWFACSASSVAEMAPVLLIDNDGGSRSVRGKDQFKNVTIARIYGFEAYNELYSIAAIGKYKTIILDNLGMTHNMIMDWLMERVLSEDSNREPNVPSQREYMIARAVITKIVRHFSALSERSINVIFTAHADIVKDAVDKLAKIRPAIAGKLAYEVPGLLSIVGYMDTAKRARAQTQRRENANDPSRVVHFQPQALPHLDAKDQSNALGITMNDPNMLKVAERIGLRAPAKTKT